jgi:hydrogenase expression/formation protein HypC
VDFGGVIKETCLEFVPDIQVGEYTIIHVGFAISKLDEEEAQRTLEMLREMEMLADELPELDEGLPA